MCRVAPEFESVASAANALRGGSPTGGEVRVVTRVLQTHFARRGKGETVTYSIGREEQMTLDPFLLFEDCSVFAAEDFPGRFHQGFERVSYVLKGQLNYDDCNGAATELQAGDIQYQNSGEGLFYTMSPAPSRTSRVLNLWLSLPPVSRRCPSSCQLDNIQTVQGTYAGGVTVKEVLKREHPFAVPAMWLDVKLAPGAVFKKQVPRGWTCFAYVLKGTLSTDWKDDAFKGNFPARHTVVFEQEGDLVVMRNKCRRNLCHFALVAGQPLGERMVPRECSFLRSLSRQDIGEASGSAGGGDAQVGEGEGAETHDGLAAAEWEAQERTMAAEAGEQWGEMWEDEWSLPSEEEEQERACVHRGGLEDVQSAGKPHISAREFQKSGPETLAWDTLTPHAALERQTRGQDVPQLETILRTSPAYSDDHSTTAVPSYTSLDQVDTGEESHAVCGSRKEAPNEPDLLEPNSAKRRRIVSNEPQGLDQYDDFFTLLHGSGVDSMTASLSHGEERAPGDAAPSSESSLPDKSPTPEHEQESGQEGHEQMVAEVCYALLGGNCWTASSNAHGAHRTSTLENLAGGIRGLHRAGSLGGEGPEACTSQQAGAGAAVDEEDGIMPPRPQAYCFFPQGFQEGKLRLCEGSTHILVAEGRMWSPVRSVGFGI